MSGTGCFSPPARLAVAHPALTVPRRSNACNNRLVQKYLSIKANVFSREVVHLSLRLNENSFEIENMTAAINH